MKTYLLITSILLGTSVSAQVIIGGSTPSNTYTQLELQNTNGQKVLILPAAENNTSLPKYNASQADGYDNDPAMEAMLMYDKNAGLTKVYEGSTWKQAFIPKIKSVTWTRARIDATSVGCISLLCSSNNLPFSIPANNAQFADYLSIHNSADTFRIRQKGLYRVNFNALFNGINVGFTGVRINIAIVVNGEEKGYMSSKAAFISTDNYLASADTVLFLDVNSNVNFRITIDNNGLSLSGYTFGGTSESNVSLEKIL
ncbi:hypothetical protein CEY12_20360 [Chryseobacterium sp. T16E-39]|uniref:hypothetical protein n=1 Tax=Chryseobacterium sp. T16E-39 TaxID=2015076 RepID=UPI000B5B3BD2|nr:hypothetical protein [Chryseobacterium sp. T16E-39]ASK32293.1 hypothetical protein CEY12_20360 [Chryseobacterium sp. T16E-39]